MSSALNTRVVRCVLLMVVRGLEVKAPSALTGTHVESCWLVDGFVLGQIRSALAEEPAKLTPKQRVR